MDWNRTGAKPKEKQSTSFGMPMVSYNPSSITRAKPPLPKGHKADPREANLMTFQQSKLPNSVLIKRITEIPRVRFFTKHPGEDIDPMLLNTNYRGPPPFAHLPRPQPPPFPLPIFEGYKLDDEDSVPSRVSLPKRPSFTREFSKDEPYDADRLDAERKGAFLSRRSATTKINVVKEKPDPNKGIVIPLAQQCRNWEMNLRDKTSKEKLITKRIEDSKREAAAIAKARKSHQDKPQNPPPMKPLYGGDDDLLRRLMLNSKKRELRKSVDMSSYFRLPNPAIPDFPVNTTIQRAEQYELELITPFNIEEILERDRRKRPFFNSPYFKNARK